MSKFNLDERIAYKLRRELDKYDRVELDTKSGVHDYMAIQQMLEVSVPVIKQLIRDVIAEVKPGVKDLDQADVLDELSWGAASGWNEAIDELEDKVKELGL